MSTSHTLCHTPLPSLPNITQLTRQQARMHQLPLCSAVKNCSTPAKLCPKSASSPWLHLKAVPSVSAVCGGCDHAERLLPVGVWSYFLHERSSTLEHFQRICHVEEVELHVDWGGRVLPGLKGFRAILQDCSLKQEKGTSAANTGRTESNSMPWEPAQAESKT